jgi:hypothetical protein
MSELPFVFIYESKSSRVKGSTCDIIIERVYYLRMNKQEEYFANSCVDNTNYLKNTEITLTFQTKFLRLDIIRNGCIIKTILLR